MRRGMQDGLEMSEMDQGAVEEFRRKLVEVLPRLRRFAWSLTSDRSEADDLVQAACEKALAHMHQWRPGSRLDSWMFKILYNQMIDETRRSYRKKVHMPIDDEHLTTAQVDGTQRIEAKIQLKEVMEAMKRLSPQDRALISLVCIEGMSYKEAAKTLDIPIGTVMSRLARARKKLHQMIKDKKQGR